MKKHYPKLIVAIRLFLGIIFFTAGMAKLFYEHKFPGLIGPVWLEDELAPHGLGLYARFIAASQILVGLLLLTQRFATLGAILLFPMLLNIFMVTVSLEWQGTPYVNFVLLLLNAWLLAYDYHKLKFILTEETEPLKQMPLKRKSLKADAIWALALVGIGASVPLSYWHLEAAWILCAVMMLIILWNQLRKKN